MKNTHYSGPKSKQFWKAVNSLPRKADAQELYSLGCALQDLEVRVLGRLANCIKSSAKHK